MDFEYRIITPDGRTVWIWEKTSIVRDPDGTPVAINGMMLDVTELKRTQEALLQEAEHRVAERARFERALQRQADEHRHDALHDELTGLPNRRQLYERLAEQMERAAPEEGFSLLLVDLDRFKEVNDVLGHNSGDQLLRQVAERFSRVVRDEDLLARLGGDEFAMLVSGMRGPEAGLEVARRLVDTLDREFILAGVPIHVEASVGIARYPLDGNDAASLLRCADAAMYAAKDLSSELELFDSARDRHSPKRLQRLGELRQALTRGELLLHYQPKIELEAGNVIGVEALVRWQHPVEGLLPPGRVRPAGRADRADQAADDLRPAHRAGAAQPLARGRSRPLGRRQHLRAQPARRGASPTRSPNCWRPPGSRATGSSWRSPRGRSWPTPCGRPRSCGA